MFIQVYLMIKARRFFGSSCFQITFDRKYSKEISRTMSKKIWDNQISTYPPTIANQEPKRGRTVCCRKSACGKKVRKETRYGVKTVKWIYAYHFLL